MGSDHQLRPGIIGHDVMTHADHLTPVDDLLAALDQFTNTVYWHQERHAFAAAEALIEAIDNWIGDPGARWKIPRADSRLRS